MKLLKATLCCLLFLLSNSSFARLTNGDEVNTSPQPQHHYFNLSAVPVGCRHLVSSASQSVLNACIKEKLAGMPVGCRHLVGSASQTVLNACIKEKLAGMPVGCRHLSGASQTVINACIKSKLSAIMKSKSCANVLKTYKSACEGSDRKACVMDHAPRGSACHEDLAANGFLKSPALQQHAELSGSSNSSRSRL